MMNIFVLGKSNTGNAYTYFLGETARDDGCEVGLTGRDNTCEFG